MFSLEFGIPSDLEAYARTLAKLRPSLPGLRYLYVRLRYHNEEDTDDAWVRHGGYERASKRTRKAIKDLFRDVEVRHRWPNKAYCKKYFEDM